MPKPLGFRSVERAPSGPCRNRTYNLEVSSPAPAQTMKATASTTSSSCCFASPAWRPISAWASRGRAQTRAGWPLGGRRPRCAACGGRRARRGVGARVGDAVAELAGERLERREQPDVRVALHRGARRRQRRRLDAGQRLGLGDVLSRDSSVSSPSWSRCLTRTGARIAMPRSPLRTQRPSRSHALNRPHWSV
jgi:hypothetical protein